MKRTIFIITLICLLFCVMSVGAAPSSSVYTIGGDCVSDVPLYTTASDFLRNMKADEELSVVVKSVSNDSCSTVGKNSLVTEQCMLKCGESFYVIDTINPLESEVLESGESIDISSAFGWRSPYILISFSICGEEGFNPCELSLKNGDIPMISFEKGADGFSAIKGESQKVRLLRYSSGERLFVELFLGKNDNKITVERLFINGEEANVNLSTNTGTGAYSLVQSGECGVIDSICVSAAGGIVSRYNRNCIISEEETARIFENYGINNTDSVFLRDSAETVDTPFGTEIVLSGEAFTVKNLFSETEMKSYKLLSEIPSVGKVRLFDDAGELFALKGGAVTIRRTIPEGLVAVVALYSKEGKIKNISFKNGAEFECDENDCIKVMLLSSKESIAPVTIAAYITKNGIFHNDGYEMKGE